MATDVGKRTKLNVNLDVPALWLAYQELGSVHKVGALFGVSGDTVHHRFKRHRLKLNSERWTDAEIATLTGYYRDVGADDFSINDLAESLGRSYAGVALKASRLGFGNHNRPATPAQKVAMSKRFRAWHSENEHPRGMKGKKHGAEARAAMSVANKATWKHAIETGTGHMSEESRQRRSDHMVRRRADPSSGLRQGYSRGSQGRRADLGSQFFRSSWEANYARYLNMLRLAGRIIKWEFEPETFWFEPIRRGVRSYLPDFKIWPIEGDPYFVEVKGYMDAKSATKLKRMAKYHPGVRIELVGEKAYRALSNRYASVILHWEKGRADFEPGSADQIIAEDEQAIGALVIAPDWLAAKRG